MPLAWPSRDDVVGLTPLEAAEALRSLVAVQAALAERAATLLVRQSVEVVRVPESVARDFRPPYLRVDEAAVRLQRPAAWLYRHADRLTFCRRIGRQLLVSEPGLESWLRGPETMRSA